MTIAETTRSAGRPRSSEADQAILETTRRLLVEQGYDAMSIEGVAAAAGVGKTTIYRRYPGKRELVVAAVSSFAEIFDLPPDSGNVRRDLLTFLKQSFEVFQSGLAFAMLGTLLVKEHEDPALLELFRQQLIRPRIEVVSGLLRQGIERGELRADLPLPLVVQMLVGAIFARHIAGQPEDAEWMEAVLDMLWRGIAVP